MLDWLFDSREIVYVLLGAAGLGLVLAWWRTRKRDYLKALGTVAVLAGLYALACHFVETPRQQIKRKLKEMAAGVTEKDLDKVFRHISNDFLVNRADKKAFREKAGGLMDAFGVTNMTVWDIEVKKLDLAKGTAEATLAVKTRGAFRGSGDLFFNGEAEFVRDSDGEWRLKSFQLFHPYVDATKPLELPW